MLPICVLASGNGSNLQAIIDASQRGDCPIQINAVISDKANAYALERAKQAGIATQVILPSNYSSLTAFEQALQICVQQFQPKLIVLAGFMRILSPAFVALYPRQIINIHPSLLPAYRGLDTHQRVLAASEKEHGATVHFVTADLDAGPVIIQAKIPIFPQDTPDSLRLKIQEIEHRIYPLVLRWFALGQIPHVDAA